MGQEKKHYQPENNTISKQNMKKQETEINTVQIEHQREHAEFHNSYRIQDVKNDVEFLQFIYGKKLGISLDDVTQDFVNRLKIIGRDIYFFLLSLVDDVSPQFYIKYKYEFIQSKIPNGSPHLFFLAWNGLIKNDSFRRLLLKTFSLSRFSDVIASKHIPSVGETFTRYRSKFVLAEEDMQINPGGKMRTIGRQLDDGSGLVMQEGIVWLPNGKGIPIFPQAYVPL
ncbi:MAG TPA: hypothetical protein P5132_04240, partial [Bacteroidales bacterium]|nr:hypothetical protein [Bacteroidales bacterium]